MEAVPARDPQRPRGRQSQLPAVPRGEGSPGRVRSQYRLQGAGDYYAAAAQTCAVCHDPHGTARDPATNLPWPGMLRFPINSPVFEQNLCTRCHNKTPDPSPSNSRGRTARRDRCYSGTRGISRRGPRTTPVAILATHGSDKNPRLCAGCHVNALTGVDAGGNPVAYSGHNFEAIPCFMPGSPGWWIRRLPTRAPMTNPAGRGAPARRRGAMLNLSRSSC